MRTMEIELLEHNDTEWVREIRITYNKEKYLVKMSWSQFEGYEMIEGWDELPTSLRKKYENKYDFMGELDEATYNEAYRKEEANA